MSKEAMKLSLEALIGAIEAAKTDVAHYAALDFDMCEDALQKGYTALEALASEQEQEEDFLKQLGNQSMMQLWQNYCDVKVERDELQEKLAKQEQCTGCEGKPSNTNNPCVICGKAKQEQGEPVAYLNPDDVCSDTAFRWCKIDEFTQPVYTTPQQRKPLTDEQIEELWHEDTSCDMPDELKQFKHTARAIEAAHGIKE